MKKPKMKFNPAILMLVFSSLFIISCNDDDPIKPIGGEGELNDNIATVRTLSADSVYTITGAVVVEEGGVLNIPAGTLIKAKQGFNNYILVLQGGKININGTADKPVKMTADINNAQSGHWGGLVINGRAPLANNSIGSTEISSSHLYGGTNPDDNSGVITYLILEYTGARSSTDVEHNGLTLNGVGRGTTIHDVFINHSSDDGIELFGGNVNVSNICVVNADDDLFDCTQGYTGTLENGYGIWDYDYTSSESDPRGVEADGNLDGNFPTHSGQSDFTIKNLTIELKLPVSPDTDVANVTNKMQDVIKLRRGARASITNAIVKGTGTAVDLIDCNDGKGQANASTIVNLSNNLTNAYLGKPVNPETGFQDVKINQGNSGCLPTVFDWTKYQF